MSGLITDMQTLHNKLNFRVKLYELREERKIKPETFANLVSSVLYSARYAGALLAEKKNYFKPANFLLLFLSFGPWFIEPVVCGLQDKDGKKDGNFSFLALFWPTLKTTPLFSCPVPFICAMDLIGAPVYTNDFLVAGTSGPELYGVCEAMYRPNLEPDDLFETISQCLLAAVDRDCLAGWGAIVHIM